MNEVIPWFNFAQKRKKIHLYDLTYDLLLFNTEISCLANSINLTKTTTIKKLMETSFVFTKTKVKKNSKRKANQISL